MAPRRLGLRVDPRLASSLQTDLMLEPPVFAIGVGRGFGDLCGKQSQGRSESKQRNVAGIARERRVHVALRKHQKLHAELQVDHAARIMLQVEVSAAIRVRQVHAPAHVDNVVLQRL